MKPAVESYRNYRNYLRDYYDYKKSVNAHFSFRKWSEILGVRSPSYLSDIINERKNLGQNKAIQVAESMDLTPKETVFFCKLVEWDPDKTKMGMQGFKNWLDQKKKYKHKFIENEDLRFLKHWQHAFVLEFLDGKKVGSEKELLEKSLFSLSSKQLDQILHDLKALGFLKQKKGEFTTNYTHLSKRDAKDLEFARRWQKQMVLLGIEAMDWQDQKLKIFNGVNISLSEKNYNILEHKIRELRDLALKLSEEQAENKKVYQWNSQLFPLSK